MKLHPWLQKTIGRRIKSRKKQPLRSTGRWSRLMLEPLEERVLLSTVVWNVDANGSWDVPGNWSTGAVPGAGDDVFLDRPAGNFTITHAAGDIAVNSIHASRNGLVISGGILTIGAASELGDFSFSSVTLKGNLTTSGTVNSSAGTISSPFDDQEKPINALTSTGTLNLTGPGDWKVSGELVNSGTIVQTGGNLMLLTTNVLDSSLVNPSIVINQPTGTYSFQGAGRHHWRL